jgi:xanthine dehydrogenase accessory factor
MRDILSDLQRWQAAGEDVALATVVRTWGSAPRRAGAKMAVTRAGALAGSVSGGCVEGAVAEEALAALGDGRPRLLHFGVADETAWEVGLACGGSIDVWVDPQGARGPVYAALVDALAHNRSVALATPIAAPGDLLGRHALVGADGATVGDLPGEWLDLARAALASGQAGATVHTLPGDIQLLIEVLLPPAELLVVGGVHIAVALVALARTLGYRTTVVEPRRAFGTPERFPQVDRLLTAWPDEALRAAGLHAASAVAVLTHDPKLDDPALLVALPSPAFYVGALGSRGTQARRRERLLAAGLAPEQVARLHGPIGLDIGANTPEEIALAIMAEIVAASHAAR